MATLGGAARLRRGQATSTRLAHGRLERRRLRAAAAPFDLSFPHARQVLRLLWRRSDMRTGRVLIDQTVSAPTSLGPE
jgi:hypothetical protein